MQSLAVRSVANAMTGDPEGGNAFTRDNDPEFVEDALPFAVKLYETLLDSDPWNANLHMTTGSLYISYANAFLQGKAAILPEGQSLQREHMLDRARNLYLRGYEFVRTGMSLNHDGIRQELGTGTPDLSDMQKSDVAYLYWAAAGLLGAFSTNPMDAGLGLRVPAALAMAERALELQPGFNNGAIHDILLSYYAGAPAALGGSEEKAREHFRESVRLSDGTAPGPYVALAMGVAVQNQDMQEFESLLLQALAVNIEAAPDNRLVNVLAQRRAQFFLDNRDRYILEENASNNWDEWDEQTDWSDWEE